MDRGAADRLPRPVGRKAHKAARCIGRMVRSAIVVGVALETYNQIDGLLAGKDYSRVV